MESFHVSAHRNDSLSFFSGTYYTLIDSTDTDEGKYKNLEESIDRLREMYDSILDQAVLEYVATHSLTSRI